MDDAIAEEIVRQVAREHLAAYDAELGIRPRQIIADQIAREAWRRLKRDLRKSTT